MTKPHSIIATGTSTPTPPTQGYAPVHQQTLSLSAVSTATPNAESNVYMVSVSSSAKDVRIYFDPALRERNEQTASLNKAVELGYEPPVASTKR